MRAAGNVWRAGLAVVLLLLCTRAGAADLAGLRDGGVGRVVDVVDGDTVRLADGRQVRLVGTQAPKLPLGRQNFPTWPLAEQSRQALAELVDGRDLRLRYGGQATDRHGRALAHLVDERRGLWVQGWMLEQGWARVYSFPDNRALVADLLAAEQTARAARRGIWGHRFYAIRTPDGVGRDLDSFQVVEGCARAVAQAGQHLYVNFGADWRSDFTVAIDDRDRRRFGGFDWLVDAAEPCLRVRGWVKSRNGPMIEVTHPEQIERLAR